MCKIGKLIIWSTTVFTCGKSNSRIVVAAETQQRKKKKNEKRKKGSNDLLWVCSAWNFLNIVRPRLARQRVRNHCKQFLLKKKN